MRYLTAPLVFALGIFATPASAQDWRIASVDTIAGALFLVDQNALSRLSGNNRTVTVLAVLSEKAASTLFVDPATLTKTTYDCRAKRYQDSEESLYDDAGNLIRRNDIPFEWVSLAPESNGDLVAQAVCGQRTLGENYRIGYGVPIPVAQARAYLRKNYGF